LTFAGYNPVFDNATGALSVVSRSMLTLPWDDVNRTAQSPTISRITPMGKQKIAPAAETEKMQP